MSDRPAPAAPIVESDLETQIDRGPARRAVIELAQESEHTRPDPGVRMRAVRSTVDIVRETEVEIGPTLGRGGMAEVRLGQQRKLERPVALKTLRSDCRGDAEVARLVREAQITGRLEHPNIVPVHDIATGPDGLPQVVLKLIEGETWTALMRDAERVHTTYGAHDLLEWNLDVLMTVCRALSFAHSRGVLHRDVKPSNVMIGAFGEVYLLDWGIALELDDRHQPEEAILGTAAYMSPEQLEADPSILGPWTDTYLLGATLFQIVARYPPHADTPMEVRITQMLAATGAPALPEGVPEELRRIIEAALDPNPATRTRTPEELRLSVARFVQHRGARRLVERAERERFAARDAHMRQDHSATERCVAASELAYRAALEEWPECREALEGLRELAAFRIERALDEDDPNEAQRVLDSHPDMPDALRERVARELERVARDDERLRKLVVDSDRGLGHRARGAWGAGFGLLWVGFWSSVAFFPPASVAALVAFPLSCLGVGAVVLVWRAPQLFENRINRTSLTIVAWGMVMTAVWCTGASLLSLSMQTVLIGLLLVWAILATGMATLVDAWGNISAVGYAAAFLLACAKPQWTPYAVVGGHAVLLVNQVALNLLLARRGFDTPPALARGRARARGSAASADGVPVKPGSPRRA